MDSAPLKPDGMTFTQTFIGMGQASIVSIGWLIRETLRPHSVDWMDWIWIAFSWVFLLALGFWRDRDAYAKRLTQAQPGRPVKCRR